MKRLIIAVLMTVLIGCVLSTVADDFEMNGIMQYDVAESVVPDKLKLLNNWSSFRLALHKVWERRIGVDANITIQNEADGRIYTYNLKRTKKFSLPKGRYRISCGKYDVSIVERRGEFDYVINRENVFYSYVNGKSLYHGCRQIEVLFYPKSSAVTVKGRIVDEGGRPITDVEVQGIPDLQSEADAYYYAFKKDNGMQAHATRTNANGEFIFDNEPPAAVELGVFYLLTGKATKPMQSAGEVALYFTISLQGYKFPTSRGILCNSHRVPLLSESNLPALRRISDKLWSIMPEDGKSTLEKVRIDPIPLPASTNNVIYIGDIVVRRDTDTVK